MGPRWNWGAGLTVVYVAFAAATLGFVAFAMDQRVSLVSGDYYERALAHDARVAAEANAAGLKDRFNIEVAADGSAIVLRWMNPADAPAPGDGRITLYRPSDDRADRVIAVAPDRDGRHRVSTAGLAPGRWVVQVHWRAGGRDYYAERAVRLP